MYIIDSSDVHLWVDMSLHGAPFISIGILREFPINGIFLPQLDSKHTEKPSKKIISEANITIITGGSHTGGLEDLALGIFVKGGFWEEHRSGGFPTPLRGRVGLTEAGQPGWCPRMDAWCPGGKGRR